MENHPPPRLSILHLLVGTTCIALYLSTSRYIWTVVWPSDEISTLIGVLWSMGTGAALGGLLLLVARRMRREIFPSYPGERLLVILSIDAWIDFGLNTMASVHLTLGDSDVQQVIQVWFGVPTCIQTVTLAVFFFAASRHLETVRWRRCFWCAGTAYLTYPFCLGAGFSVALALLSNLILIFAVVGDHNAGRRFPWTHWLGVGVKLWFTPLMAAWLAYFLFWRGA